MSLKDFEILSKIGEGAYSKVYKVKRLSDQETYALKKVPIKTLKPKEKNNALNEIRLLASVSHPNVISYKQAFFDNETESLCIIMEYADGGDLYQRILEYKKKSALMSENFLWHLLIKLTRALRALHELDIMHRDLKSANVFLTKDGKVKLGDMNVSKVAKEGMNHTQTGTPFYASPEVWKDEAYDTKSDIWSLGCVLYEAAALVPPFQAEDMKSLYKKVTKGSFPTLPELYSRDFCEVLSCFIIVDPKKRPSAAQILRLPLVNKRVNVREDSGETERSSLLGTIKLPNNIQMIRDRLPSPKYHEKSKSEPPSRSPLPQIVMLNRGLTGKSTEEGRSGQGLRPAKHKYEQPARIRSLLREQYAAQEIPSVRYPNHLHSIPEVLLNYQIRKREEILPSLSAVKQRGRKYYH
jgi:NIMA (never in mitosis gene a)-related kinase 1/4/5